MRDTDVRRGLEAIVRELARAVEAEVVVLGVGRDDGDEIDVLAAVGLADGAGLGRTGMEGFIRRAMHAEYAHIEPIGSEARGPAAGRPARLAHAAGAAVRPPDGPRGALCACFADHPGHAGLPTVWLVESFARLAALCLHDHATLQPLLDGGGRRDGLTGCLTQDAFQHELRREIKRSERHGLRLACCFADVDDFKRINDRYGHLHGSRVLANVADILRAGVRSEDTLGRYGGDEFVLLLPDTDEPAAAELATRLRAKIATTLINRPDDPVDISLGVAAWEPGAGAHDVLQAADAALLEAKRAGGGRVVRATGAAERAGRPQI